MNQITIIGNLTRDPEIATTQSGIDYAKFSVAVSRKFGEQKQTDFFNCTAWRKLATEVIGKYCKKGDKIFVSGRMESNTIDGDDGKKRTFWDIAVDEIELLGGKKTEQTEQENELIPVSNEDLPF